MNGSADTMLHKWLSDGVCVTVTQEDLLGGRNDDATSSGQDDVNPHNNRKSRIQAIQDEIAGDENSPETEIIIDDNQAAEVEQKPDETEAQDELEQLLIALSDCKTTNDLVALNNRCLALPEHLKKTARIAYGDKVKQLDRSDKEGNDTCFKCTNQDNLSTCGGCGHDYCLTHWPSGFERCETCIGLDDLVAEDN